MPGQAAGTPDVRCRERWFELYCQAVPACIGPHRGEGDFGGLVVAAVVAGVAALYSEYRRIR